MTSLRLVVLDANPPWVRSLFLAMPQEVEVHFLRVYHLPGCLRAASDPVRDLLRGRWIRPNVHERWVPTLGWRRFSRWTTSWIAGRVQDVVRRHGPVDWLVVTLPHYADTVKRLGMRTAYYSYDPYQFYAWWTDTMREREDWLLANCDLVTAVSRQQVEDFRPRTRGRLEWSPNATSEEFLRQVREAGGAKPAELAAIQGRIVGCVGQVGSAYDLDLVEELARRFADVAFVFVGPVAEPDPTQRARIDGIFSRPNVHWLGPRPHAELPYYLAHFDVCLNPLRAGPHADRRSPLRLYDYLTTDHPILSTPVREAEGHAPHVRVVRDADGAALSLRDLLGTEKAEALDSRREHISRNTWTVRAREYLGCLGWWEEEGAVAVGSGRL